MNRTDLRSLEARTRAVVDADPPTTRPETRRWIVEPLLSTLGWDPRSAATDVEVGGRRLEYVLSASGTPALLVAVQPFPEDVGDAVEREVREAMAATGIDRAIHTNGRRVVLLGGAESPDRFECDREELAANADALDHVTRSAIERRLANDFRRRVARRIAVQRDELGDRIENELSAAVDDESVDFGAAADAFLSRLVDDLLSGERRAGSDGSDPRSGNGVTDGPTAPDPTARERGDGRSTAARSARAGIDEPAHERDDDPPADDRADSDDGGESDPNPSVEIRTDASPGAERADPETAEDDGSGAGTTGASEDGGEYVVRFFGDRGSIGAIGHSSPRGALAEAAEYLFDRGLSGIRLPWSPDGSDATVVNDRPRQESGEPMERYRELSNGHVVNTAGTVEDQARRIRALTERAGLRAMLSGDWESSNE